MINPMMNAVALDADFMIKYLCEVPITDKIKVHMTTTHVAMWIVMIFIMVLAVVARVIINKADASDTPGAYQNVVEMAIDMLGNMVNASMGPQAKRFVNYITAIFIFIIKFFDKCIDCLSIDSTHRMPESNGCSVYILCICHFCFFIAFCCIG